jgi:hypothetical protein
VEPEDREATGTPRWVKVFGAITVLLVALIVVLAVTGRAGDHGPGRHDGPPPGITHEQ